MNDRFKKDRSHPKRLSFPYKSVRPEGPLSTTKLEKLKLLRQQLPEESAFDLPCDSYLAGILGLTYATFLRAFDNGATAAASANDLRQMQRALEGANACSECSKAVHDQKAALAATHALDVGMIFEQLDLEPFLEQAMKFSNNPNAAKGPEARARQKNEAMIVILDDLWKRGVRGKENLKKEVVAEWLAQARRTKPDLTEAAIKSRVDERRDVFVRWLEEKQIGAR